MAKKTNASLIGTSGHGVNIQTSVEKLIWKFGRAEWDGNDGEDKTNYTWVLEIEEGDYKGKIFTIYDWKYYRPLAKEEIIEFNIGAESQLIAIHGREEILNHTEVRRRISGMDPDEVEILNLLDL